MSESASTGHQQTVAQRVADAVAPAVVRIGREGGRGCGIVVGEGLVATNAHNLRDRTTEVTFADGRATQGRATAVDPDGDLTVLAVDTAGIAAPAWADAVPSRGHPGLRGGGHPGGPPRHRGRRVRRRPLVPRTAGSPRHRCHRAHRPAGQGHVGQPGGRRRGPRRRAHHPPARRRPLAGAAGRRGAAPPRRRPRRRPDAPPPRARRRHRPAGARPAACGGPSACPTATARSCAAWPTAARPTGPGWPPATSSPAWAIATSPDRPISSRRWPTPDVGAEVTVHVVRGADELDLTVTFDDADTDDPAEGDDGPDDGTPEDAPTDA